MGRKKGSWCCAVFTSNSEPLNEGEKKSKKRYLKNASFIPPIFREPSTIEQILEDVDQHHLHHPSTQPQLQPEPQPRPQPESVSEPEPQPEPQVQTQPKTEPDPQPQVQPQPKPEPQPQVQPEPQSQPQVQPEPRPQPKPQPQPQPKPQPKQSQPKLPQQPKPKGKSSSYSGMHVSPPEKLTSPPKVVHQQLKISYSQQPTLQHHHHHSATRIQAVYRGYMTRKNIRGLTGLVRLQRFLTSQNVKRQTLNALKQMQSLVRVQTQIQSRRIQTLQNQAFKPQPNNNPHKQSDEYWDDSVITKEERDVRLKRKEEALINKERAKAYAFSHHQLSNKTLTSSHQTSHPWWWKWLEPQLPYQVTPTHQFTTRTHTQLDSPTRPMSSSSTNRSFKNIKTRKQYPNKDDDSLMSCPPFSVPNYMSPTASARAKARPVSNPKETWGTPTTPASVSSSKRRFSFPFTPNNNSAGSIGDLSIDSGISVNASMGRKPFNRFV